MPNRRFHVQSFLHGVLRAIESLRGTRLPLCPIPTSYVDLAFPQIVILICQPCFQHLHRPSSHFRGDLSEGLGSKMFNERAQEVRKQGLTFCGDTIIGLGLCVILEGIVQGV